MSVIKKRKRKVLNFDVENEQLIISAMMSNRRLCRRIVSEVAVNEFVAKRHRIIFDGLQFLLNRRLSFSIDTLSVALSGRDFGGAVYLRDLKEAFEPNVDNVDFHLDKLRRDAIKFRVKSGAFLDLTDLLDDPAASLSKIESAIGEIRSELRRGDNARTAQLISGDDAIKEYDREVNARESLEFRGFNLLELDERLTEALAPGLFSIIAARTSIGKSTFVANVVRKLAVRKIRTLYAPLETKWIAAIDTLITSMTGLPYDRYIRNPEQLTKAEREKINRAKNRLFKNRRLKIWRPEIRSIDALENEIASGNYDVVFIDLFENLLSSLDQKDIALALKRIQKMAQDYNVHICAVHQIRRDVVKRNERRPRLDDLKNSGGYEESADLVLLLHRDYYYRLLSGDLTDDEEDIMEVWISKQRRGRTNVCVAFRFDAECGRIGEYDLDYVPNLYGEGSKSKFSGDELKTGQV